jgi:transcriptional regulator with XRE-family HTH domain
MDVRERIRATIAERKTTPRAVSLKAGLSDSMVHKFLTGATTSLTLDTVDKIAAALQVDPAWLAYGEGTPDLATDIAEIVSRIPEEDREQLKRVLEAFAVTKNRAA